MSHKNCLEHISMWNHWTARTCHPHNPFSDFEFARWFWIKMRNLFPETIAAVQMPNHIHLILPRDSPRAFEKLTGLVVGASRKLRQKNLWEPFPSPTDIPDRHHLRRQVRYVALNPCRKGLCHDPLEWVWSSYRDLVGATSDGEKILPNLLLALNESPSTQSNFIVRFHSYVSGDPSVDVAGTPFPKASLTKDLAQESIGELLSACAATLRLTPDHIHKPGPLRNLFIHAAYRHGWRQPHVLARICGIRPNSVHWILNKSTPVGITAMDLCLGDSRLRRLPSQVSPFSVDSTKS